MPIPATVDGYFALPDAKRILLLEITRNDGDGTKYYLSDDLYQTDFTDNPYMLTFSPVIGGSGLPALRRILADPFEGAGSTSFGGVTLNKKDVAFTTDGGLLDLGGGDFLKVNPAGDLLAWALSVTGFGTMTLRRGATVEAKIAAPRQFYGYDTAQLLMRGQIARIGGSSRGETTIEITDSSEVFRRAIVPVTDKPLCFGRCRNVSPFLTDALNLEYAVHDGEVQDILAVYDQGVALTEGVHWTKDAANGTFTLTSSPAGVVTADVEGEVYSGSWVRKTQTVAERLIARAGQSSITQEFGQISSGVIGLYLTESTELGTLLTKLMRGASAYWLIDATGVFRAEYFPIPGVAGELLQEQEILSEVEYQDDDRVHSSIRYLYRRNWTQYQSLPAASQAQADFSPREGLEASVTDPSPDSELQYSDSERLDTYFDDQDAAATVAGRILEIFKQVRIRARGELPYSSSRSLGQPITLAAGGQIFKGIIVSLTDVFDGSYPAQQVEVLA